MIAQASPAVSRDRQVQFGAPVLSQYDQRMRAVELTIQLLIARTARGEHWSEGFKAAGKLLAALPLTIAMSASVNRHFQNAVAYSQQAEFGASTFELRAVRGQLLRL